ncbi:MAG: hypothetical protein ACREFX_05480 [Opitutaceae bacterium]
MNPGARGAEVHRLWRRLWIRAAWIAAAGVVAAVFWGWRGGRLPGGFWLERLIGPIATETAGGLKVSVYAPGGLRLRRNRVTLEFRDGASGEPVNVGAVRFELGLATPRAVTHTITRVAAVPGKVGRYRTMVQPDSAGIWTATVSYRGPRGSGAFAFPVPVKPDDPP